MERAALKAKMKHSIRPVIPLLSVNGSGSETTLRALFASLAVVPIASTSTTPFDDSPAARKAYDSTAKGYKVQGLVKVVPNRVYSLAVHPSMEKDIVFVGDKKGCIGVWDRTDYSKVKKEVVVKKEIKKEIKKEGDEPEAEEEDLDASDALGKGRWYHWQAHMENSVSCIGFRPNEPGAVRYFSSPSKKVFEFTYDSRSFFQVYSGAYDCTVRKTNFLTFDSEEVINGDAFGSNNLIYSFGFTPDGNEIWGKQCFYFVGRYACS